MAKIINCIVFSCYSLIFQIRRTWSKSSNSQIPNGWIIPRKKKIKVNSNGGIVWKKARADEEYEVNNI